MLYNFSDRHVETRPQTPRIGGLSVVSGPALLSVHGVTHRYGDRVALDDLHLDVVQGETLGLLGPNGAGKTTLMSLMSGLVVPQKGKVDLLGVGEPRRVEARGQLGLAPQRLALYEEFSAEENIRFFGRLFGLSGAKLSERVEWALDLAELPSRRRDRVRSFSGGMQRRLNLACAVVHAPRLVLLDEPTVGVDPQSRDHIFASLERLKADGRTIVYSTHYMEGSGAALRSHRRDRCRSGAGLLLLE